MRGEASDDDAPGRRPPPDPLDRVWVHPSELAPVEARLRARRRARGWALPLTTGTAGALAVLVVLAAIGSFRNGDPAVTPASGAASRGEAGVADLAELVAAAAPSIVAVTVTGPDGTRRGSGVCIRHAGDVLTGDALVRDGSKITVTAADGSVHAATVAGRDPDTGLSLLRVDADLRAARLADDTTLSVGDPVIAVGADPSGGSSPWVSTGIVASVDVLADEPGGVMMTGLVETDATAGSGLTGGALLDADGAVAGILLGPVAGRPGTVVVPIAMAAATAQQLRKTGTGLHGWLGLAGADGPDGPVVTGVVENGPAARSGIEIGEVVITVDGRRVLTMGELMATVRRGTPGTVVTLEVRRARRIRTVDVRLGDTPGGGTTPTTPTLAASAG